MRNTVSLLLAVLVQWLVMWVRGTSKKFVWFSCFTCTGRGVSVLPQALWSTRLSQTAAAGSLKFTSFSVTQKTSCDWYCLIRCLPLRKIIFFFTIPVTIFTDGTETWADGKHKGQLLDALSLNSCKMNLNQRLASLLS